MPILPLRPSRKQIPQLVNRGDEQRLDVVQGHEAGLEGIDVGVHVCQSRSGGVCDGGVRSHSGGHWGGAATDDELFLRVVVAITGFVAVYSCIHGIQVEWWDGVRGSSALSRRACRGAAANWFW